MDGNDQVDSAVLSKLNNWTAVFKDLPVYRNGTKIVYSIKELEIANYTVVVGEIVDGKVNVTNTHVPVTTEINVTKVWNDENDYDGIRPDSVTVYLFADGEKVNELILTAADGWIGTFSNLPVYKNGSAINYSIAEGPVEGYNTTINNDSSVMTIVNSHIRPNMTVQKVTIDKVVLLGDNVTFMIVVTNNGNCNLSDLKVSEIYNPDELTLLDIIDDDNGKWSRFGDDFCYNGNLTAGDITHFTIVFKTLVNGTLLNQVNASTNETESKTANNTTVVNELCDLEITKLVNASNVYVNETVEWTIIVVNHGPNTAKDVIINDTLPNNIKIESCSHVYEIDGNNIIWNLGELKSNDSVKITLITQLLAEGKFDNIVVANTSTNESSYDNNKANNTTYSNPICDLIINKTVNASHVYVNDTVEWTITVINVGPSTAINVIVKDTLPEGAIIIDYDDSSAGSFYKETRIWEIGELEINKPVSLVLVTKVLTEGNITNIVNVNTTTYEPNKTNNEANNTTVAYPICDLEISKAVTPDVVNVTDSVEWTIVVINHGPNVARNVVVNDTLPQGLTLINAIPSIGNYTNGIWNIGDLDVGTPVSLVLITQATEEGNITNIAVVNTTTNETDKSNNIANNTTEVLPTIRVINHGPSAAVGVEVLEDIPSSLKLIGASASKGTYNKDTNIWTIGKLDKGAIETLVITTEVLSVGNITNPVEVSSNTPDTNKSNNKANNTTEAFAIVDLAVIKSSDKDKYHINDTICWTITVFNKGPCDAHDVLAIDVLPSGVKFMSYNASKGSYDVESGKWTIGDLANGESVTMYLYCVALDEGIITNEVNVTCNETDSDLSNNHDNSTVEVIKNETPVTPSPQKPAEPAKMLATGNPIASLIVVIMVLLGSFWIPSRKE